MRGCVITMKTRTAAERAERAAQSIGIKSEAVSVDPSFTKHGCSMGILVGCGDTDRLIAYLKKKGIPFGEVIGG